MTKINPLPSLELLHEALKISKESPSGLVWRTRPRSHFQLENGFLTFNRQFAGEHVGGIVSNKAIGTSYWRARIFGTCYMVHRVVYALHHNILVPVDTEIDHIDNNGLNNSVDNLRVATMRHNQRNRPTQSNNTSGVKGVIWHKKSAAWYGKVRHFGKTYETGYTPSKEVATQLVRELREKLHKEFTHHG